MRIILQCHHRTHVLDMLKALKWMSIKQRLLYNLYILLWKIVNNRVPDYLSHIFTPVSHMHNYNTRSSTTGNFFMHRTSQKSLSYLGAKYWNQLPQHIWEMRSLYGFKKCLVHYIFENIEPLES